MTNSSGIVINPPFNSKNNQGKNNKTDAKQQRNEDLLFTFLVYHYTNT